MAFKEQVTQLTTTTTNLADNFNKIHQELLENDKFLKQELQIQLEDYTLEQGAQDTEIAALKQKDIDQDTEISGIKTSKLNSSTFTSFRTSQEAKDLEQDNALLKEIQDRQTADVAVETKLDNKITLNGEVNSKSNFNFIGNGISKDGLVDGLSISNFNSEKDFLVFFKLVSNGAGDAVKIFGIGFPNTGGYQLVLGSTSLALQYRKINETAWTTETITQIYPQNSYTILLYKAKNSIYVNVNGVNYEYKNLNIQHVTGTLSFNSSARYSTTKEYLYNKLITPKEIQHNLSVLNNPESINGLETGDKKLLLSTDSNHVEMATGRTLEEEYTSLLKQHGKEFTSTGSAINVANGIRGKVLSGEIKGQTVKNICKFSGVTESSDKITVYNTFVANNNNYSFKNFTDKPIFLQIYNASGDTWVRNASVGVGQVINITSDEMIKTISGTFASGWSVNDKTLLSNACMIIPTSDINKITSYIPFGLSSTQAVINVNGQSYPIYASEEDRQNKKVILCHKVDTVADTIALNEDGSGLWSNALATITPSNESSWVMQDATLTNTLLFQTSSIGTFNKAKNICDMFKTENYDAMWSRDEESLGLGNTAIRIRILKSKLVTQDLAGFIAWLQANPVEVVYQLTTPIIATIDKSIMPTIQTADKINILNVESPVAPSEFKVSVPVDRIGELETRLAALEGVAYSASNMSLSTNYIDDEYNKNLQTESEMI